MDDFLKIQKEIENQNFDFILVSLKDLVKLKVFIKPENQKKSPIQNSSVQNSSIPISKDFYNKIFYIDIDLEISGDLKAFEKVIDEILV
ncbi:MAG TPA: hypothetical protein PLJ21_03705 [Pseudobdellovibrionaceae bacterium]|nr:hypothetical protein [Pseudobdellovibrionaceae bacterium]